MQAQKRPSGEGRLCYMERNWEGSLFFFAAAAGAGAATAGASGGVGTADALFTALLCLIDKETGSADNRQNHGNNHIIDRIHRLTSFRTKHILP